MILYLSFVRVLSYDPIYICNSITKYKEVDHRRSMKESTWIYVTCISYKTKGVHINNLTSQTVIWLSFIDFLLFWLLTSILIIEVEK